MDKSEIIIGRQVEKGDYHVDKQYKSVGRKHARIVSEADGIYIEDLSSTNGTFVNGIPISRKKITPSDTITLGGTDHYTLNLAKVLQQLPVSDKDFQDRFLKLRQVYDNYQKEKVKIQSESQGKMMLKRSLPMAVPGVLMMCFNGFNLKVFGGILSALSIVLGSVWASKSMAKMPERLNELRELFLREYVCPNCGHDFGERPWENIRRQGKCKACQREFDI